MNTPDASFYVTGGTLRQDAPSYVERQADKELFEGLQRGEFCYVLTSRQMGKSSLMIRTAARLSEQGVKVAVLDLTAFGANLTAEQWYEGLLGVGIRHDRPLRHGDHAYLRCQACVYNGPSRGAVRPWVIGEALLTGRARDAHRMVYGQLGIGNL